ncbi:unnamed protein product [Somion occarium]|uniref:Uncharacterized protein n=1 Tax=Somion occarium TaxID=3059160 RepID=A0ABP1CY64_9APHY
MFSKLFFALTLVLGLTLQVSAHALVAPPIGVTDTPVRKDVKRPSNRSPCGAGVNVAKTLASSTPIVAAADGTFTTTVTNFNAGTDGSRQVTAAVDTTAIGKTFAAAATVTQNGDPAPKDVGSEQITVQMPAGTTCTGGATGDQCLVSFKTSGGFGNCVLVQQSAGAAAASNDTTAAAGNDTTSAAGNNTTDTTATGNNTTDTTATGNNTTAAAATIANTSGKKGNKKNNNKRDIDIRAVGSRAARAFREAELDELMIATDFFVYSTPTEREVEGFKDVCESQ